MVNTKMFEFKHPKYYKELRKRNKLDQAISPGDVITGDSTESQGVRPDPGLSPASSGKHQATSAKHQAPSSDKKL
jgi:hypothetical protein